MKLQVDRAALLPFANRAAKIASSKSPAPILSGVLLRTGEGLSLASSDAITGYMASVTASVAKPGGIVVNAKAFADAVDTMPVGMIDISATATSGKLNMKSGKRVISLSGVPAAEYPVSPPPPRTWTNVAAETLVGVIKRVSHAIGPDSKGPPFTGLFIDVKDNRLRAYALDGSRLAMAYSKENVDSVPPVIFSGPFAKLLQSTLGNGVIKIGVAAPNVFAVFGAETLYSKLYEAGAPDLESHWQRWTSQTRRVRVNRKAFLDVLNTMHRVADITAVHIEADKEQLVLSGSNPDKGAVRDTVTAAIEGEPTRAKSAIMFLIDAVSALDEEDVRIDMGVDMEPIVVRPADGNDSWLGIIMTMDPSVDPMPASALPAASEP